MPRHAPDRSTEPPPGARADDGAGIISSIVGLVVFLGFLLFAVQLALNLYAVSLVNASAYDAARVAAADNGGIAAGHQRLQALVGNAVTASWTDHPEHVTLRVSGENPTVLPSSVAGVLPFTSYERTVTVRKETLVE